MSVSRSYDFSAPPEVVFHSLTDPDRTGRWLPRGVSLEFRNAERMVVRGRVIELQTQVDAEQMRLAVCAGAAWRRGNGWLQSRSAQATRGWAR